MLRLLSLLLLGIFLGSCGNVIRQPGGIRACGDIVLADLDAGQEIVCLDETGRPVQIGVPLQTPPPPWMLLVAVGVMAILGLGMAVWATMRHSEGDRLA